ncbi:hypothetical protein A3850_005130 [Lewinella sp. 4G2]|nr:hypothetical protein A3850_005130 [Lewinella sp. 4G2]
MVCIAGQPFAQTSTDVAYQDYGKVLAALSDLQATQYTVNLELYEGIKEQELVGESEFTIWNGVNGEAFFSSADVTYLATDNRVIFINHVQKQVQAFHPDSLDYDPPAILAEDLRPIMEKLRLFPLRYNPGDGQSAVSFCAPGLTNTVIKVEYDQATWLPSIMATTIDLSNAPDLYYEYDQHHIVAKYGNYVAQPDMPITPEMVVKTNGESPRLTSEFAEYSLVD